MVDKIDYAVEISGVDRITVNGKVYLAADTILEIIDAEMDEVNCIEPKYWLRLNKMRGKVLDLKVGEQK